MNPAIVLKQNAYMLFYEKIIKADGPSQAPSEPAPVQQPKPAPKPSNKKRQQQRNKRNKKKGGAPTAPTSSDGGSASTNQTTEATPQTTDSPSTQQSQPEDIKWETPKYKAHYREADDGNAESFLKDFIISVDLPPVVNN